MQMTDKDMKEECDIIREASGLKDLPWSWDGMMRARECLLAGADYSVEYVHFHTDDPWIRVTISIYAHPHFGDDPEYEGNGGNDLEAMTAALHEIAKAKLEEK